MTHGERLTEYTSFELQMLLDSVALKIDDLKLMYGTDNTSYHVPEKMEALSLWATKIIEAKAEVRVREINATEN